MLGYLEVLHHVVMMDTFIKLYILCRFSWLITFAEYSNPDSNWRGINSSQIWSLSKQKWIQGPQVPRGYFSLNSCAIALNSTAVLIIGLIPISNQAFDEIYNYNHIGLLPNPATFIYNFQSNSWIEQESLPYEVEGGVWEYFYDNSCQVVDGKNTKR